MDFHAFQTSLSASRPPADIDVYLRALWYDGKGDWDRAHGLVDDLEDKTATRIHAYLHRKEGDQSNARYWYARSATHMPHYSLDKEWEELVKELLERSVSN